MEKKRRSKAPRRTSGLKKGLIILLSLFVTIILVSVAIGAKVLYDVKGTTDKAYEPIERTQSVKKVNLNHEKPFSVLLLGVDTGALGRTEQGRSDTLLVATVNPQTEKTLLVSLPRDTYTEIVGYGTMDKINHAYAFGGTAMTIATVEKLLDIHLNYYVTINMQGIESLVDAVGGIDVSAPFAFSYEDTEFPIGSQHLDGDKALKYSRMRYDDPEGDYGRQGRQRQVIQGIAKQALSIKGVTGYQAILSSFDNNIKTDISFDEMETLLKKYRNAFQHIDSEQAQGEGFMQDGISYQRISPEELTRIQNLLKEQLKE